MIAYYFDSSALIKRYITETGSGWVRQLFPSPHDALFITCRLTIPEIYSAFARRRREGTVSQDNYTTNIRAFDHDSMTIYRIIELTADVTHLSRRLLEQHPLRASDAVQLASALTANRLLVDAGLPPLLFLCGDNHLLDIAITEALTGDNPNDHP